MSQTCFTGRRRKGWRPHRDDDDASLGDDVLGQVVEDGVGAVFEGPQLLHPLVQLDVCSHVLVEGAVHRRGSELDHRVIFLVGLLNGRTFRKMGECKGR